MRLDDEQVTPEAGAEEKIKAALDALSKDPHAPREITVRFTLHIHNEYPKHVVVGQKDGVDVVQVVNSEEEEEAALAAVQPADPQESQPAQ